MKILIVGFGSIGRRHLQVLKDIDPSLEIAVLRQHSKSKDLGEDQDKASAVFFDIKEALRFKPQAVFITNPAPLHISIAKAFAKEGAHLFIEKPISTDLKGLDELFKVCAKKKLVLLVGYVLRYAPALQIVKEQIAANTIGKVLFVTATVGQHLPSWRPQGDYRQSVTARRKLGGGVVLELSHEIDYLSWLFGSIKDVSAFTQKCSDFYIDVEDLAEINLRFKNGIIGHIHLDMLDHHKQRFCRIVGSKGTLVLDLLEQSVRCYEEQTKTWVDIKPKEDLVDRQQMFRTQAKHFFECVRGQQKPLVSGIEGKKVLEVALAIKRSAQTGKTLRLKGKGL